jgi:hypothetical protein
VKLRYGAAKVAVEQHRSEILAGVVVGKPLTMIYEELRDRLAGVPFRTFAAHARRIKRETTTKPKGTPINVGREQPSGNGGEFRVTRYTKEERDRALGRKP